MTYKGPEFGKSSRVVTKRQEDSSNHPLERTPYDNTFFPFSAQTHTFPYHYAFPYSYGHPYTYFSNPYYPPYSYVPQQRSEIRVSSGFQSMESRQMESQLVEQYRPVEVKIEPSESSALPEEQPVEIINLSTKYKQQTTQRTSVRKDYKRKEYLINSQNKLIFNKLVRAFLSQETNLNKEKAEFKKCLKQKYQIQGNDTFYDILFQNLKKKFSDFKKTKEQMIKYIIRRTYHNYKMSKGGEYRPELDRLQQFHQKNLSLYKSMNSDFLRKQFSNKLFVEIYKEFLDQMDQQFQKENEDRIERLSLILNSAWADKNIKLIAHQKKLPWTMNYKRRVKQIAYDLLKQFEPPSFENKEESEIK